MRISKLSLVCSVLGLAALAGCSGSDPSGGPGFTLSDNQCAQLRGELASMDKRGVPSLIDARSSGKTKFSPQQEADIGRYNQALDQYLGGQCASEQRYKAKGMPKATTVEAPGSAPSRKRSAAASEPTSASTASTSEPNPITTSSVPRAAKKPASEKVEKVAGERSTPAQPAAASTTSSGPARLDPWQPPKVE
jgi:hypothetical protein